MLNFDFSEMCPSLPLKFGASLKSGIQISLKFLSWILLIIELIKLVFPLKTLSWCVIITEGIFLL